MCAGCDDQCLRQWIDNYLLSKIMCCEWYDMSLTCVGKHSMLMPNKNLVCAHGLHKCIIFSFFEGKERGEYEWVSIRKLIFGPGGVCERSIRKWISSTRSKSLNIETLVLIKWFLNEWMIVCLCVMGVWNDSWFSIFVLIFLS